MTIQIDKVKFVKTGSEQVELGLRISFENINNTIVIDAYGNVIRDFTIFNYAPGQTEYFTL